MRWLTIGWSARAAERLACGDGTLEARVDSGLDHVAFEAIPPRIARNRGYNRQDTSIVQPLARF
jgi:hypothetical protein